MQADYILLRLPLEVADLFTEWLKQNYPLKAEHILGLIYQSRGGKAYDPAFNQRMQGTGQIAELINQRFRLVSRRLGLDQPLPRLRCDLFRKPNVSGHQQLDIFD